MRILRYPLAVVVGLLGMFVTVALLERLGHVWFPPPPELNAALGDWATAVARSDSEAEATAREAVSRIIQGQPAGAFVALIVAWVGGVLVGGGLAALVAPSGRLWFAVAIGLLNAAAIYLNGKLLTPPSWVNPVAMACVLVTAVLVGSCVSRWCARRAAAKVSQVPAT